jgi:hypothetical protein
VFITDRSQPSQRRTNKQALNEFFAFVEVLDWPTEAAARVERHWDLEAEGRSIGAMEVQRLKGLEDENRRLKKPRLRRCSATRTEDPLRDNG